MKKILLIKFEDKYFIKKKLSRWILINSRSPADTSKHLVMYNYSKIAPDYCKIFYTYFDFILQNNKVGEKNHT